MKTQVYYFFWIFFTFFGILDFYFASQIFMLEAPEFMWAGWYCLFAGMGGILAGYFYHRKGNDLASEKRFISSYKEGDKDAV